MSEDLLISFFPGLRASQFRVTSSADCKYNCIAWAANDTSDWWWPCGNTPPVVWPPTVEHELSLEAFSRAFHTLGYVVGGDESLEPGLEKVALFADTVGVPTHAARQLPSGHGPANSDKPKISNTNYVHSKAKSMVLWQRS